MISDLIRDMDRPSAVIATVCWPIHKKAHLVSALTNIEEGQVTMFQFLIPGDTPPRHSQDQHIVFLADLQCPNISDHFKLSSTHKHFRSPFRWILIGSFEESTRETLVPASIEDVDLLVDGEVMVAKPIMDNAYQIYYIYKVGTGNPWLTESYGTWDTEKHLQKSTEVALTESTASRRLDLHGFEISVCYVLTDNDSFYHMTDGINDHIDTLTKVNYRTTNHLLDLLNASRRYVYANTWGYKLNGTWNGLTGYLVRDEVEFGGSPMFFTSERIPVVDYISSPTPTRSKFVFQQPKLSYENNLFLLSFKTTVWYSILGLIFLMFLALLAVAHWEWHRHKNLEDVKTDSGILRGNVKDVALLIYGAACQQGSTVELKGSLGRVVMLVLFISLMFLYTSYSANIVALLQSSSSNIRTLEDLLHSRIKFGVHDTVFNRYYFSTATEPTRKAIYQTKVAPPGAKPSFMTMEEGVKNIQKGLFAFHMEIGVGYKFVGKYFHEGEKCGLKEIQYLQVIDPWQAVRKNTPYKELFKIG
ncbi:ligand-gated ion channel domain-containing protein [Phthorimaea operculella]|nr:ligand-gated ion channel domain-containing protein [Phthorimaea operculella]